MSQTIETVRVRLPIPDRRLGKSYRPHWTTKRELTATHLAIGKYETANALDRPRTYAWQSPVRLTIHWFAAQEEHWPDLDNVIARCHAYIDGAELAGLLSNDKVVRSIAVEYGIDPKPHVIMVWEQGEG